MKKNTLKRMTVITTAAMIAMLSSAVLAGCGCEKQDPRIATADEIGMEATMPTIQLETLNETDQAVVDAGLTVDDSGNITDDKGNKVKVSEDGKVEIKTADGKTVKVDAKEIKTANENKVKVDEDNAALQAEAQAAAQAIAQNSNSSGSSKQTSNSGSGSSQTSKTAQTSKTSQTSKAQTSQTSKSQTSQTSKPSQTSQTSKTSQASQTQATTADPHAGKTWHEAEYKTINHPAVTEQVWVVDVPEHTETVTEYENVYHGAICWGCDQVLDGWSSAAIMDHMEYHHDNGEETGYRNGYVNELVTRTITVKEKGHYETRTVKEAWTEKVLVRAAGWY